MYILYSNAGNEIWILNPNITQYLCKQVKDALMGYIFLSCYSETTRHNHKVNKQKEIKLSQQDIGRKTGMNNEIIKSLATGKLKFN